ncbi:hypothetical protein D9758_004644 [Tetrapyrgos nigripes]|uniref:Uncharacterized protein n=1 Tax=Tetrapyrgos nigripes TaxID=182062 RepID=A0A8H5GZQ3_9AGAR|nr:hypothetical protein D9758_004644 [Tetrapyrgos nigripes]
MSSSHSIFHKIFQVDDCSEGSSSSESYAIYPSGYNRTSLEGGVIPFPPKEYLSLGYTVELILVLPSFISIERYNYALAQTLAIFLPACGRFISINDGTSKRGGIGLRQSINPIVVEVFEDYHTERFPHTDIIIDKGSPWTGPLGQNLVDEDEALVRIRFTRIHQSGEMVYGLSWSHALGEDQIQFTYESANGRAGDGFSLHLFTVYIAHFYRGSDISQLPIPTFSKTFVPAPPSDPRIAAEILPLVSKSNVSRAKLPKVIMERFARSLQTTVPVRLRFTVEQLDALVDRCEAANGYRPSRVNAMVAYFAYAYNTVVSDERKLTTILNTIGYRGTRWASPGHIGNAVFIVPSPSFSPSSPTSGVKENQEYFNSAIASIAAKLRLGTKHSLVREFLDVYLPFYESCCRDLWENRLVQDGFPASEQEITINSCYRVDYRKGGDFGFQCSHESQAPGHYPVRMHMTGMMEKYLRIFRANLPWPGKDGKWEVHLEGGAEMGFTMNKMDADMLIERIRRDQDNLFCF